VSVRPAVSPFWLPNLTASPETSISALQNSKVDFVAADNPHATPFLIHILFAVAEHERNMISSRTKAALEAAKRRGVKL